MHASSRHIHKKDHTIVLGSRRVSARQPLFLGSNKGHFQYTQGSPPQPPPRRHYTASLAPPSRKGFEQETWYTPPPKGTDLLARFGIDSQLGRVVVRTLVFLMLFQPVYVALGMEIESEVVGAPEEVQSGVSDAVSGDFETSAEGEVPVVDETADEVSESEESEVVTEKRNETSEEVFDEDTVDDIDDEEGVATDNTDIGDTGGVGSGTDDQEESDEGGGEYEIASTTDEVAPTTEEVLVDEEDIASTTDEVATSSEEDVVVTEKNDNTYIFNEGDCTLVSEGEYYCVADGPERQAGADPRVYAQKDREGDREIYYFDGVEVKRITNNSYDDFAPVFDEETMRVVWQAMIQDRLQIMLHDIETNTTRQVTTGRQNSSNPNITRDTIVWQEWIDTNWEIMMTKVGDPGEEFKIERLTDNVVHDMFPAVYDDLLTWQSERGSSWEVVVYDLTTGKRNTLKKDEDTKYENPRFVLLFDSKHDNGDVETIGYDLETGEKMELGTKANPQPSVPVTPKEEVPEAIPVGTVNKVGKEDGDPIDPTIE